MTVTLHVDMTKETVEYIEALDARRIATENALKHAVKLLRGSYYCTDIEWCGYWNNHEEMAPIREILKTDPNGERGCL